MKIPYAALFAFTILAGCATGNGAVVTGAGPNDLLKLRSAPGLSSPIIVGLPDGTRLRQHGCVPETGQMWCKVSLEEKPRVSGYVSADYLSTR